MAEQADFYVKNLMTDSIQVVRRLPDGTNDLETVILSNNEEKITLIGTDVLLIISAPGGVDTKYYPLTVKADIDLAVVYSRTYSQWKIRIEPNTLPPDAPTTVNVDVGSDVPR
ncbi:MAG: hypothetical protein ACM3SY_11975 [Candidatus Omnitrophota bacterium]